MNATRAKQPPDLNLLRGLAEARTYYQERFGWPVTVQVDPGRLLLPVGELADAVVLPRQLGWRVLTELRIALLAGPVLADTTGQWWMFLTRPAGNTIPKDQAALRCLEVHLVPSGSRVVVPSEIDEKNGWPWIERPRALHQLPPWRAVIATARRAGTRDETVTEIPAQRMGSLVPVR